MFKALRKSKGLTQGQLAKELDVDTSTVGKWELGFAFPRPLTLIKLAELYKVPIQDFYSVLKEKEEKE